jgi:hypothetical protein
MRAARAIADKEQEYRRYGRRRVMLAAKLYSVHGETTAVLLDLSRGGAMLSASPPLPVGCKLLLVRRSLEASATVAWAEGSRLGLQFAEPLAEQLVDYLVSRPEAIGAH